MKTAPEQTEKIITDLIESYYFHSSYTMAYGALFTKSDLRRELEFNILDVVARVMDMDDDEQAEKVWDIISKNDIEIISARVSAEIAFKSILKLKGNRNYKPFTRNDIILPLKALCAKRYVASQLCNIQLRGDRDAAFEETGSINSNAVYGKMHDCILKMVYPKYTSNTKVYEPAFDAFCGFVFDAKPFEWSDDTHYNNFLDEIEIVMQSLDEVGELEAA
jgi:hypothetical protein